MNRNILILEPYYGGSHKVFLDGLSENIDANCIFLTLPARKWKMRMQLSAIWFIEKIRQLVQKDIQFDLVLCSTFVDVAVLRSLLSQQLWWDHTIPLFIYFHENQFNYPGQVVDPQINQFTSINFTSSISADFLAFNSRFNRDSFLQGISRYLKKATDMEVSDLVGTIKKKSTIIHPGLDFSLIDTTRCNTNKQNKTPVIVWNHRWEHDKNPEEFFSTLYRLQKRNIDFSLILLGQSFRDQPRCFLEAQKRLASHILHFSYVDTKKEYINLLCRGDIVISTARHEFFGISVIEAVRAGCYPLLPNRLVYPELFGTEYLYAENRLTQRLKQIIEKPKKISKETLEGITNRFQWSHLKKKYEKWFFTDTIGS